MRKVQFSALFWTLALAIPFTVLALSGAAYLTDHLGNIATAMASVGRSTVGSNNFLIEFAARWPEVAGMIIGQIVIFAILYFARTANPSKENNHINHKS